MSIISIHSKRPRLHPLGSRKRHYEQAVQPVGAVLQCATALAHDSPGVDDDSQLAATSCQKRKFLRKGVRLLIPIFLFAAIYLYGMLDQVSSTNNLTSFENNLFVFLAPAMLFAVGGINTYGLWKSRRKSVHNAQLQ